MNPINIVLLQPTDVLFFRDGRPMEGSLAGHGAAWPLPNVTDAAFHAALHRSGLNGHAHDQRRHVERRGKDNRQFGSLVTAGPFPVRVGSPPASSASSGTLSEVHWFFPRPLDLQAATLTPSLLPTARVDSALSSLPMPLQYPVASTLPPSKDNRAKVWLHADAFQRYLVDGNAEIEDGEALDDSAFSDHEATVGIAIDAETGTTGRGDAAGKIYSARYLRLRDGWRLGVLAKTDEKNGTARRQDLIPDLINEQGQMLVGGQQRLCTAQLCKEANIPLPLGKTDGFSQHHRKWLVKWVLLSPAIWPEIPALSDDGRPMTPHCGGWLPNWVRQADGQIMLRSGERQHRSYQGKHSRGYGTDSKEIDARLVAALVPKPIPVTGWALPNGLDRPEGGAKSTHLAVPAGAVYYFEASTEIDAQNLAAALNWHGREKSEIRNQKSEITLSRRSTLMGEKGFGLGVCGTWRFHGQE